MRSSKSIEKEIEKLLKKKKELENKDLKLAKELESLVAEYPFGVEVTWDKNVHILKDWVKEVSKNPLKFALHWHAICSNLDGMFSNYWGGQETDYAPSYYIFRTKQDVILFIEETMR